MDLRWSDITSDDVEAWSRLTHVLAVADDTGESYAPEDLAEELREHGVDPTRDTWAVWDGPRMVAYAQVRVIGIDHTDQVKTQLDGGVDPQWRGHGLGRRLMDELERRALELSGERHPGVQVVLRASGLMEGASVRDLLARRGYEPVRYFTSMRIALTDATLSEPAAPVRPYVQGLEEATRVAHNDAFATHWGSKAVSVDDWRERLGSRAFRPEASVVALADDGTVESYSLAYQWVPGELYIGQVGTTQSARGHGLARACLLGSLRAGQAAGYDWSELDVDSDNPTGAGALYTSVGFRALRTKAAYARVVPAQT